MMFSNMSLKIVTTKYTADCFKFDSILPHLKIEIKRFRSYLSLDTESMCWTILNFNVTHLPDLLLMELRIDT